MKTIDEVVRDWVEQETAIETASILSAGEWLRKYLVEEAAKGRNLEEALEEWLLD